MCIVFFFFKQNTAYEMRISDWSSDVCSSDLLGFSNFFGLNDLLETPSLTGGVMAMENQGSEVGIAGTLQVRQSIVDDPSRSEEGRVGKECVSTGRSRLWTCHSKKKT